MAVKASKINNPLTVVSVFVGVVETGMTTTMFDAQRPYIQILDLLLMSVIALVVIVLFFSILWKDPTALYAPTDYRTDEAYTDVNRNRFQGTQTVSQPGVGSPPVASASEVPKDSTDIPNGTGEADGSSLVSGKKFHNEVIQLDYMRYEDCEFTECTIVYAGSSQFHLVRNSFINCTWSVKDHAEWTVQYLRFIFNMMGPDGRGFMEKTFFK